MLLIATHWGIVSRLATLTLRERKKERTRATITRVALELFARDGFTATTITDIAQAAEVSPRTVSTYFSSKEGIVFDVYEAAIDRFAGFMADRSVEARTLDVLRTWLLAEHEVQGGATRGLVRPGDDDEVDFPRLREAAIASDVELWGLQRRYMRPMSRLVAAGVARDLGEDPESLRVQLASEAVVNSLLALNAHAARRGTAATDQLDTILDFLRGGLAAFQNQDSA